MRYCTNLCSLLSSAIAGNTFRSQLVPNMGINSGKRMLVPVPVPAAQAPVLVPADNVVI